MAGMTADTFIETKRQLIRKMVRGVVAIADTTADAITQLTDDSDKGLMALPDGYEKLGYLTDDGAQFARNVDTSDITSWGETEPTRSDVTSDQTTLQVACQETKKATIGLYTGADMTASTPAANGELRIEKPALPDAKYYRVLTVGIDKYQGQDIYIARFMPNGKVTDYDDMNFQSSDDSALSWSVTFSSFVDSALGYSEAYMFGGPGWYTLLSDMGMSAAAS